MIRRLPSLGNRLRLQFLILGVLPALAVYGIAWALMTPALIAQAEEHNRELAVAVRDQVGLQLDLRLRAGSVVADALRFDAIQPTSLHQTLGALIQRDGFLQAASVTDSEDQVIEAALPEGDGRFTEDIIGLDLSRQDYVRLARRDRAAKWSNAYLSTLTGQVTAALAIPAGHRTVVLELSLRALSQSVRELAQSGSTTVLIVDRSGHIIAHPDFSRALRQESLSHWPAVRSALGGHESQGRRMEAGAEQLALALPVEPVGWAVVVSQPLSEVMAPTLRLGGAIAGVLGLTLIVASLTGWRLARNTGEEVRRLVESAQQAAQGEAPMAGKDFSTAEFDALWTRLHILFQRLHTRDEQTRAARADLQAVLDAATQAAIIVTDCNGLVTSFNVGAQRLLGWRADEVLGRLTPLAWHDSIEISQRAKELSHELGQDIAGVDALFAHVRRHGHEVRDWRLKRRDGSFVDVSLAVTAMHMLSGGLKGFLAVAVDITERRRVAELEIARKTAELANRAKSEFLSKMSHELRTPLNAILGFAQLVEADTSSPLGERQREGVRHIQSAGWHLVRLIDDVLDLARIEAGGVRVEMRPVEIAPLLQQAAQIVSARMTEHKVTLSINVGQGTPARMVCDDTRLVQVLVNLLSNAAKYNRPGGEVRLASNLVDGELQLSVEDTGLGMTAEQLEHLYEPFNRLGRESGGIEGTGIGLVITQHLVTLMRGRIEVTSHPDFGTRFVVVLPLTGLADLPPPVEATASGSSPGRGRILYIEDNEVNGQLMHALLAQRPGIELRTCRQAASGLAEARSWRPRLLLLDMHLPETSGREVLAEWQADPVLCGIPVLVISADATETQIDAALQLGARAYLTKPLALDKTLSVIDEVLNEAAVTPP